jgi:hypothetical protein
VKRSPDSPTAIPICRAWIQREPAGAIQPDRRRDPAVSVHGRGSDDLDETVDRRMRLAGNRQPHLRGMLSRIPNSKFLIPSCYPENPIQRPPAPTPNHNASETTATSLCQIGRIFDSSARVTFRRTVKLKIIASASDDIFTQNAVL